MACQLISARLCPAIDIGAVSAACDIDATRGPCYIWRARTLQPRKDLAVPARGGDPFSGSRRITKKAEPIFRNLHMIALTGVFGQGVSLKVKLPSARSGKTRYNSGHNHEVTKPQALVTRIVGSERYLPARNDGRQAWGLLQARSQLESGSSIGSVRCWESGRNWFRPPHAFDQIAPRLHSANPLYPHALQLKKTPLD